MLIPGGLCEVVTDIFRTTGDDCAYFKVADLLSKMGAVNSDCDSKKIYSTNQLCELCSMFKNKTIMQQNSINKTHFKGYQVISINAY